MVGFFEFFSDMGFVLKIFVFIAIIGFLNQHIQNKTVKIVVFMFMAYFILVANWAVFGTIWIIYTVLGIGVSGMLVDFFFVAAQSGGEMPEHLASQQPKEAINEDYTPTPAAQGAQAKNAPMVRRMGR